MQNAVLSEPIMMGLANIIKQDTTGLQGPTEAQTAAINKAATGAKLTPEDKKRMGWTKEFDESVPKRLNEAINANVEYHRERDQW